MNLALMGLSFPSSRVGNQRNHTRIQTMAACNPRTHTKILSTSKLPATEALDQIGNVLSFAAHGMYEAVRTWCSVEPNVEEFIGCQRPPPLVATVLSWLLGKRPNSLTRLTDIMEDTYKLVSIEECVL